MMSKCDLRLKKTPKRETKRASEARVVPPVDVPLSLGYGGGMERRRMYPLTSFPSAGRQAGSGRAPTARQMNGSVIEGRSRDCLHDTEY